MKQFINLIRRRLEYVFYGMYGLLVMGCIIAAFWPQPEEHFQTFVPQDNIQIQSGQAISIEYVKAYGIGALKKPVSVFADASQIYVSDAASNTVVILNRNRDRTVAVISKTGKTRDTELNYPNAVVPFGDDKLLVTESGGKRILQFKKDSAFVRILDLPEGNILKPGFAVARDNKIFIADLGAHDIKVLDDKGKFVSSIGTPINNVQLLKYPQGMDSDYKGNLWVADGGNERVLCFDKEGRFIRSFNGSESGGVPFSMVKGLAIINTNYLCVSDPMSNKIRIFDITKDLKEIATLGGGGKEQGDFIYPMGLFADENNHLFVADRGNSRIQEFAFR